MYKAYQTYLIKNFPLAIRSEWMLDKTTLELVNEEMPVLKKWALTNGMEDLKTVLSEYPKHHFGEVYSMPLFTQEFCDMMLDEIENMKQKINFTPNEEEDEARQIPEILLQDHCPEIFNAMYSVVSGIINPVFHAVWQRVAESAASIQIANYNLKDKKQGAWHHDASSDFSVVVPLNTGKYKGGGTEFHNKGIVEPLPSGHALFFPSFTHMHRGLPVTKGDRYLLVFWLKGNT